VMQPLTLILFTVVPHEMHLCIKSDQDTKYLYSTCLFVTWQKCRINEKAL